MDKEKAIRRLKEMIESGDLSQDTIKMIVEVEEELSKNGGGEAQQILAELMEDADENYDTFKEISDWIASADTTYMVKGRDYVTAGQQAGTTLGQNATAEGIDTTASGDVSHAEGEGTTATAKHQHVGGKFNIPDAANSSGIGTYAEIIGNGTSNNDRSNARTLDWNGNEWLKGTLKLGGTSATDNNAVDVLAAINNMSSNSGGGGYVTAGQKANTTLGQNATAEGEETTASGNISHAEGYRTTASGNVSHAEGDETTASGSYSHTEGSGASASQTAAHAEGYDTTASGMGAHAEGNETTASGSYSHAEGQGTTAAATGAHAEGSGGENLTLPDNTVVKGGTAASIGTHVEGYGCYAEASRGPSAAHAEGYGTIAILGGANHAEGLSTIANAQASHAEGNSTTASGMFSHSEGTSSTASGMAAHAEGSETTASGYYSHAEGNGTTATGLSQHAGGEYNIADTPSSSQVRGTYVEIIGNGTKSGSTITHSNARTLDWSGNEWLAGTLKLGGTSATDSNAVDVAATLSDILTRLAAAEAEIRALNGN